MKSMDYEEAGLPWLAPAHGGAPVRDPARARLSHVSHCSQASTCFFHKSPHDPGGWDIFRHGEHL